VDVHVQRELVIEAVQPDEAVSAQSVSGQRRPMGREPPTRLAFRAW
jgi:hypothetical protein